MITIRFATTEDIDAICAIETACFDHPWSRILFDADIKDNPNALYWLAVDVPGSVPENLNSVAADQCTTAASPRIVGFVGTHNVVGEINITNVAVHPDYRQQGIGAQLLAAMTEYFDSMKADAQSISSNAAPITPNCDIIGITLEVRPSNTPALKLYQSFGFKEEGRRKRYYQDGEDAIIMWRR